MTAATEDLPPLRIASVADDGRDEENEATDTTDGLSETRSDSTIASDAHLDELCERLVWWCRTRRFYGKSSAPVSLLGKLRSPSRPMTGTGPDAACSAECAALYLAMLSQPVDALDRIVFELHYFHRVGNVKVAAAELKIGRQHWYTLLRQFRRRIHSAAGEIMRINEAELAALPHRLL